MASSRFGANNRYGVFLLSLWLGFQRRILKSDFFVHHLKIRGGYGVVGNDNISNFGYVSTVSGGSIMPLEIVEPSQTGYANNSLDNPDLWIKKHLRKILF